MSIATARVFHDEQAAYRLVEELVWPDGPVCPHCGGNKRISKMQGRSTRIGTYKCYACRKPFTVKLGTMVESSHVPLHVWLKAIYLISCSERRVSLLEIQRCTGVTLRTAWFIADRVRRAEEACEGPSEAPSSPVGVSGTTFGPVADGMTSLAMPAAQMQAEIRHPAPHRPERTME